MNLDSSFAPAERLESFKAGLAASFGTGLTFVILWLMHQWLNHPLTTSLIQFVIQGAIALFSGFLFGVTYRYVVRSDQNVQLQTGAIFAFGLIRGLATIEDQLLNFQLGVDVASAIAQGCGSRIAENIILFAGAAIVLNFAFKTGWIKRFSS